MLTLLTLLVGHQGRRLVWLRRTNGGVMQLEVLGAIGLFLLAIEAYGRLGRAAVEVLGEWADAAAGSGACDQDAYLTWVKRELSVTLVRGNARLFKKFVGVLTRGIGQRFVEGMDVPVLE